MSSEALSSPISGFVGATRDRRRDEMLPCFYPTTRKRNGAACIEVVSAAERAARIERYRGDVAAGRPIQVIPGSVTLTKSRRRLEAAHGPTT